MQVVWEVTGERGGEEEMKGVCIRRCVAAHSKL